MLATMLARIIKHSQQLSGIDAISLELFFDQRSPLKGVPAGKERGSEIVYILVIRT